MSISNFLDKSLDISKPLLDSQWKRILLDDMRMRMGRFIMMRMRMGGFMMMRLLIGAIDLISVALVLVLFRFGYFSSHEFGG